MSWCWIHPNLYFYFTLFSWFLNHVSIHLPTQYVHIVGEFIFQTNKSNRELTIFLKSTNSLNFSIKIGGVSFLGLNLGSPFSLPTTFCNYITHPFGSVISICSKSILESWSASPPSLTWISVLAYPTCSSLPFPNNLIPLQYKNDYFQMWVIMCHFIVKNVASAPQFTHWKCLTITYKVLFNLLTIIIMLLLKITFYHFLLLVSLIIVSLHCLAL